MARAQRRAASRAQARGRPPRGYLTILAAAAGDLVRAEPFDAVELKISALVGLEDDEE